MKILSAFGAFILASACFSAEVLDVKVETLDGFGGDTGTVISRCQTKVGDVYDPITVSRDVNTLKNSREYDDIRAEAKRLADGVEVTFYIRRKLRYVAPLTIRGSEFFSESKIASESKLVDGYLYGEADLAEAAKKVRELYQKKNFLDAKVSARALAGASIDNCTIVFDIEEGARQKISRFDFTGIDDEEEEDGVRKAIGDLPWWNPLGWFSDLPVTAEAQSQCLSKIEEYFRDLGYLDMTVTGPVRIPLEDEGEIAFRFDIVKGARYSIGGIELTGITKYPEPVVREKSNLPASGDFAGAKTISEAAHRVEVTVGSGDYGLADTRVEVKRIPREDDPSVLDFRFVVKEGVPVVINEVRIVGNDYTKDKVIRREIQLGPGDRMLADRAERSQKKLENLDYFSRVRYSLAPTDKGLDANGAEYRDLVYEVEEKNTGQFMIGLGASSVDSVYLSAEVQQANFDILAPNKLFRGGGQKGRLYAAVGPRIQTYEASVTEPHFLDRFLELNTEVYRRQRWYDEYDIIRTGAGASLSYPVKLLPFYDDKGKLDFKPFGRFGFRLGAELIDFDDVEDDYYYRKGKSGEYAKLLKEEEDKYGGATEGQLRFYWSHDSRDNFRIPTKGSRTQIFADLGGGDNEYWRIGFSHRHYFTTWERYNHVLLVALRAETIDSFSDSDGVPIYNRMFLGGPRSVRGIEYRNVSPMKRERDGGDWIPWGGQTLFCMNFEYTIPIVKMLRLAAFSDLGSVGVDEFDLDFSDTFAWTVGLGIRIDIPMFPIRLDFATPIEKPDEAEEEVFSFTIGYDF